VRWRTAKPVGAGIYIQMRADPLLLNPSVQLVAKSYRLEVEQLFPGEIVKRHACGQATALEWIAQK
jgi:hypothetical protein